MWCRHVFSCSHLWLLSLQKLLARGVHMESDSEEVDDEVMYFFRITFWVCLQKNRVGWELIEAGLIFTGGGDGLG